MQVCAQVGFHDWSARASKNVEGERAITNTVVCRGIAAHATERSTVRVQFKLPFHTQFGQGVSIVGESSDFGQWDTQRARPLQWSEGDIWTIDVELQHSEDAPLSYKYIVTNPDGRVLSWKPGGNLELRLRDLMQEGRAPQSIRVSDCWDGNYQEVEVEEAGEGALEKAQGSLDAWLVAAAQTGEWSYQREQQLHQLAVDRAFQDLDRTLAECVELQNNEAVTPDSQPAIDADRAMAAAARRAIAMTKAREVTTPPDVLALLDQRSGPLIKAPRHDQQGQGGMDEYDVDG